MALKSLAFLLILLLHPLTPESHWRLFLPRPPPPPPPPPFVPPPLCSSQFALVNRACARLPYTPVPPPSPPAPPSPPSPPPPPPPREGGDEDGEEGEHRREHRHRRHVFKETPAQEECCRWLREVDNSCVCGVVAHLPAFMTRPVHNYTVVVDESCNVTFQCGSALHF